MQKVIIACHVMGQSMIVIPAKAMISEGVIAVGWSRGRDTVEREVDGR